MHCVTYCITVERILCLIYIYIYIYKNNLKIMILKGGVGIDHCYKLKSKETRLKHAIASIAIKSKEQGGENALDSIAQSI